MEELDRDFQGFKELPREFGVFGGDPAARTDLARVLDRFVAVDSNHDLHVSLAGLAVGEVCHFHDIGTGLADPIEARDTEIEIALLHIRRDLLRAEDLDFADAVVGDRGIIVAIRAPDLEVSLFEELECLGLKTALRECDGDHTVHHHLKNR